MRHLPHRQQPRKFIVPLQTTINDERPKKIVLIYTTAVDRKHVVSPDWSVDHPSADTTSTTSTATAEIHCSFTNHHKRRTSEKNRFNIYDSRRQKTRRVTWLVSRPSIDRYDIYHIDSNRVNSLFLFLSPRTTKMYFIYDTFGGATCPRHRVKTT